MTKKKALLKLVYLFIAASMLLAPTSCQQKTTPQWPQKTNETAPWTRWWWHGSAVDKANLTANLEELKKNGFGGVEITPIYDVKGWKKKSIPFQSEKWMEMLEHTLKEGKRLGLGVDLANASGWPFGGQWISAEHACKNLQHKKYTLKGGQRLSQKIEFIQPPMVRAVGKKVSISEVKNPISSNNNLQELALDQIRFEKPLPLQTLMAYNPQGSIIDLTNNVSANGTLDWTAPEGTWTLYAVFMGWHGKMVERAGTRGEGNVIDHFSEEATKIFLADFDKNARNIDLSGIRAFFNDSYEVDDALGNANWTPHFFEAFEQHRGYDLKSYLPALFGDSDEETNKRVLCDYRETISDLLLEKFTKNWANWASSHNAIIRNQAHGSPANILDLYEASHIPETEGTYPMRIKMATSAGHISGKPLIACEAATWLKDHFLSNLTDVKQNADRYLANGVNHIVYHGTPYSPTNEKWPGWMFYAAVHFAPTNTWWNDLKTINQYITNCQSFLQNSTPANDILLYFPIYDAWTERSRETLPHFGGHTEELTKKISNKLIEKGFTFDYISDKQIWNLISQNGEIITNGGASYKTIIIPNCNYLPPQTFKKLLALAKSGATILFEEKIPQKAPGLNNFEKHESETQKHIKTIHFEPTNNFSSAQIGKGKIWIGKNIEHLLNTVNIHNEELATNKLWFNRINKEEGPCYFICNWSGQEIGKWIKIQHSSNEAAWFNPMNNRKGKALTRKQKNGETEVYIQLTPGETLILQWYQNKIDLEMYPFWQPLKVKKELNTEWYVSFETGGPTLPDAYKTKKLNSWTTRMGAYATFSGTAVYKTNFGGQNLIGKNYRLDLGKVHESVTVTLNNNELGTLTGPTFQIILPSDMIKEENTLELRVTNLMANRIIDLDKNGINYKKFYNINFAAHERENRGSDGNFSAANWTPLPSGLLGPVTLTEITQKQTKTNCHDPD